MTTMPKTHSWGGMTRLKGWTPPAIERLANVSAIKSGKPIFSFVPFNIGFSTQTSGQAALDTLKPAQSILQCVARLSAGISEQFVPTERTSDALNGFMGKALRDGEPVYSTNLQYFVKYLPEAGRHALWVRELSDPTVCRALNPVAPHVYRYEESEAGLARIPFGFNTAGYKGFVEEIKLFLAERDVVDARVWLGGSGAKGVPQNKPASFFSEQSDYDLIFANDRLHAMQTINWNENLARLEKESAKAKETLSRLEEALADAEKEDKLTEEDYKKAKAHYHTAMRSFDANNLLEGEEARSARSWFNKAETRRLTEAKESWSRAHNKFTEALRLRKRARIALLNIEGALGQLNRAASGSITDHDLFLPPGFKKLREGLSRWTEHKVSIRIVPGNYEPQTGTYEVISSTP